MLYIAGTIVFTVLAQIFLKWQGAKAKVRTFLVTGFLGFLAFLCWTMAMTRYELSYAYPFTSISFVLVFFASVLLFHERATKAKIVGLILIVSGIVISSRG